MQCFRAARRLPPEQDRHTGISIGESPVKYLSSLIAEARRGLEQRRQFARTSLGSMTVLAEAIRRGGEPRLAGVRNQPVDETLGELSGRGMARQAPFDQFHVRQSRRGKLSKLARFTLIRRQVPSHRGSPCFEIASVSNAASQLMFILRSRLNPRPDARPPPSFRHRAPRAHVSSGRYIRSRDSLPACDVSPLFKRHL